ncbi:MAG: glycosyltransferase family 4 protein [Egibacteraceae bacterium]
MRLVMLSTYPPRVCGIATFAADLRTALLAVPDIEVVDVLALLQDKAGVADHVVGVIAPDRPAEFRAVARLVNDGGYDGLIVQHEFGIYGGVAGRHVLELVDRVSVPVVTTAHTVIGHPPAALQKAMCDLADASARLVVLTEAAVPLLIDVYGIDPRKITVIPHGVPDVPFDEPDLHKATVGLEGRTVLLTFGLLSRNKGIEHVIEALPPVVADHPDVRYVVLGTTHPEVKRSEGEAYRAQLEAAVDRLGLADNVEFRDRYASPAELADHLLATDVYVTPYQSREQIASGTLAYAVGMGRAVVSTPYRYAEQLLADGRGRLVPFRHSEALTRALLDLLDDREGREAMRWRAYAYGRSMTWPEVGRQTARVLRREVARSARTTRSLEVLQGPSDCARLVKLDHLELLTDDTGLIQHATHGIPDRRLGYTTDDQSRALVVAVTHHARFRDERSRRLAMTYLAYLHHAQLDDGRFHNLMGYDRRWRDAVGTEDTLGQSLWAVGVGLRGGPTPGQRRLAGDMFDRALRAAEGLGYARSIAYALCGLTEAPNRHGVSTLIELLAERLVTAFGKASQPGWQWCDDALSYANTKIGEALLRAGVVLDRPDWQALGLDALDFVLGATYDGERFDFIGNQGWADRGGAVPVYAQQPIEAGYTAQACRLAHAVTNKARYARAARDAVAWLLGRNRLGAVLYDPTTGACADGLERTGVSSNAGAESVVCALLGLLAAAGQAVVLPGRAARAS